MAMVDVAIKRRKMLRKDVSFGAFPELYPDERTVLERRGACRTALKTGWRTGRLFLTEKRLLFAHGGRILAEVPYASIRDMQVAKRWPFLKRSRTLVLTCGNDNGAGLWKVWLAVKDASSLAQWLCWTTGSVVRARAVDELLLMLDAKSRSLIRHLSENRDASTKDLARLLACEEKSLSLHIDQRINAVARRIIGRDVVVFRKSWFDAGQGEFVGNNWWLVCPLDVTSPADRPAL